MLSYIKKLDPRKEKPPATATTTPTQEEKEEEVKAPVLSLEDESFLSTALETADAENVIFEGGGSETTGASTPVVAEDPLESKHGHRTEELKETLASGWEGLKRGVSQKRKGKENSSPSSSSLSPSTTTTTEGVSKEKEKKISKGKSKEKEEQKINKGKSKEKEKEVEREDELTSALEQLNLAAEDVSPPLPLFSFKKRSVVVC
jgi:hypothetical protein